MLYAHVCALHVCSAHPCATVHGAGVGQEPHMQKESPHLIPASPNRRGDQLASLRCLRPLPSHLPAPPARRAAPSTPYHPSGPATPPRCAPTDPSLSRVGTRRLGSRDSPGHCGLGALTRPGPAVGGPDRRGPPAPLPPLSPGRARRLLGGSDPPAPAAGFEALRDGCGVPLVSSSLPSP